MTVFFLDARDSLYIIPQFRFQNFHEQGEREALLAEVSELRNQVYEDLIPLCPYLLLQ